MELVLPSLALSLPAAVGQSAVSGVCCFYDRLPGCCWLSSFRHLLIALLPLSHRRPCWLRAGPAHKHQQQLQAAHRRPPSTPRLQSTRQVGQQAGCIHSPLHPHSCRDWRSVCVWLHAQELAQRLSRSSVMARMHELSARTGRLKKELEQKGLAAEVREVCASLA